MSAYYLNGLNMMRARLLKEHRSLMARYGRMERMGHPDLRDQGRAIDLNKRFLDMVKTEIETVRQAAAEKLVKAPIPPESTDRRETDAEN
jgi:hypothetical protein